MRNSIAETAAADAEIEADDDEKTDAFYRKCLDVFLGLNEVDELAEKQARELHCPVHRGVRWIVGDKEEAQCPICATVFVRLHADRLRRAGFRV